MAERRMFAKAIIDSDAFLDMPLSAQALYFHLGILSADDDGFVANPKRIQRYIGASDDDLKLLIAKGFILTFESGVIVIKHWRVHNYIRSDRYKETLCREEKAQLTIDQNNEYDRVDTDGIPTVYRLSPQVRLGKVRLGKDNNSLSISAHAHTREEDEEIEEDEEDAAKEEAERLAQLPKMFGAKGSKFEGLIVSDDQLADLLDQMGLDMFEEYAGRLLNYIRKSGNHPKNHYQTILKWWQQDGKIERRTTV